MSRKFNVYWGVAFIGVALILNEKTLALFSSDGQLISSTVNKIRGAQAVSAFVGVMLILGKRLAFLWPKNPWAKIVLFYIGFAIFLEAASRFVLLCYDPGDFFRKRLYSENRNRLEVIAKRPLGLVTGEEYDAHHPLRGWTLKPNLKNISYDSRWTVSSNSKGIRGVTEYPYAKPADKLRIVAIGDSFTYGEEVFDGETYPAYLNDLLPDGEVINMGVHGYGQDQMLLYLKEEGIKYHPDIVLLGFVQDDMRRNTLDFNHYFKPRYILKDGQLQLTNTPIAPIDDMVRREVYQLKILDILSSPIHRIKTALFKPASEDAISEAILDEMHRTVQSVGAQFLMVYIPSPHDLFVNDELLERGETFFDNYCRNRQVHCLSLKTNFESLINKGEKLIETGHWDAKGNRLIAGWIKDYLMSQKMVN